MVSFFDQSNVSIINSVEYQFLKYFRLLSFNFFNLAAILLILQFSKISNYKTLAPELHCGCKNYSSFGPRLQK